MRDYTLRITRYDDGTVRLRAQPDSPSPVAVADDLIEGLALKKHSEPPWQLSAIWFGIGFLAAIVVLP